MKALAAWRQEWSIRFLYVWSELTLKIREFFGDGHLGPFISWRIYGILSWDLYALRWPLYGRNARFLFRLHFAICLIGFRPLRFMHCGGASGTRVGVDWGNRGWQIGYDNGWHDPADRNRWIITRYSWAGSYPYKILSWTWRPFWYPK